MRFTESTKIDFQSRTERSRSRRSQNRDGRSSRGASSGSGRSLIGEKTATGSFRFLESGWRDSNSRNLPLPKRALYQAELHPARHAHEGTAWELAQAGSLGRAQPSSTRLRFSNEAEKRGAENAIRDDNCSETWFRSRH